MMIIFVFMVVPSIIKVISTIMMMAACFLINNINGLSDAKRPSYSDGLLKYARPVSCR